MAFFTIRFAGDADIVVMAVATGAAGVGRIISRSTWIAIPRVRIAFFLFMKVVFEFVGVKLVEVTLRFLAPGKDFREVGDLVAESAF